MQFNSTQAIYLQIADYVCEKVLLKVWKPEDKIPSVRELAVQLEVNPNTVMRTYDFLEHLEVIRNQRGIGFFLGKDAPRLALQYRRREFTEGELPQIYRNMYLLGMEVEDLKPGYEAYKRQHFSV